MQSHNATPSTRYAHLLPPDAAVWRAFIRKHGANFDRFEYDVHVGYGRDPGPAFEAYIRQMAIQLSQRRIDAVGFHANARTIIEITRSAGLTAIGQLIAYPILYRLAHPGAYELHTLLVCESIQDDLMPAINAANIPFRLTSPT